MRRRPNLADPLRVLVLVVDDGGQHRGRDPTQLLGGTDVAVCDVADPEANPFGHGGSVCADALDVGQVTSIWLLCGAVHDRVDLGVDQRFRRGEVAHHVVSHGRLMPEMPGDCARVLRWAPHQLGRAEVGPELVGVAERPVVLLEEFVEGGGGVHRFLGVMSRQRAKRLVRVVCCCLAQATNSGAFVEIGVRVAAGPTATTCVTTVSPTYACMAIMGGSRVSAGS